MSFDDLSEDLIVDIFSRLQIKPLLRFRSVSKSLYACIGSPAFIRLHTLRSSKKVMIMITHRTSNQRGVCARRFYTLHSEDQLSYNPYAGITPIEYPFKSFSIVGSCNGILCVYEYGNGTNLWNPLVRRKVTIHDIAWSPCSRVIGFGFDPTIRDYKILVLSRPNSFVYTMKTHSWHEIASPSTPFFVLNSCQCLFNGSLHWVVKRCLTRDVCHYYIMKFDLSSEVFSSIELPKPSWETGHVTIIEGCLAVISSKDERSRIWVRRDEYNNTASSWSVVFEWNRNPFKGVKRVFQRATNGDLLLHHFSRGIRLYSPDKQNRLCKVPGLNPSSFIVGMSMCVESLELLGMGTSCKRSKSPGIKEKNK